MNEIKVTILDDGGAKLEVGEKKIAMTKEEMWEVFNLLEGATDHGEPGDVFETIQK